MERLQRVIRRGLERTEERWPEVRAGFALLRQMAEVLKNAALLPGEQVRQRFREVVAQVQRAAGQAREDGQPNLVAALEHFVKVCGSYEPGLFYCYDVADLPPEVAKAGQEKLNALEQEASALASAAFALATEAEKALKATQEAQRAAQPVKAEQQKQDAAVAEAKKTMDAAAAEQKKSDSVEIFHDD